MQAFDASSIIHAWDHYPPGQFPPLWAWIASRIAKREFCICEVALAEVEKRAPDCHAWLRSQNITCIKMTDEAVAKAAEVKAALEIINDRYHSAGVGENDILILASACTEGHRLISNERRQAELPKVKARYKIPLVCSLPEVSVECIDFLTLIKESGEIFGGAKH